MRAFAWYGGTFDPIHHGHLRAALEAASLLDAEVHVAPSGDPPHRDAPQAQAPQRLDMVRLAVAGVPGLVADDREQRRPGPSYTVDTLAELRAELGPERPLVLLVGADAFAGLSTWNRWREVFVHAHVGVLSRPGYGGAFEAELAAEWFARRGEPVDLLGSPCGRIAPLPVTPLEISASAVREACRTPAGARYLVPATVHDYIVRHGLYRR